jgi:hypothetical protein
LNCKKQDQQNGQPKIRHGQPQLAECHDPHITGCVLFGGSIQTQAQGHQNSEAHGHDGQRRRHIRDVHGKSLCLYLEQFNPELRQAADARRRKIKLTWIFLHGLDQIGQ